MTYSLFQLLLFFDSQSHCDFQAIYAVLEVIDSQIILDTEKRTLIIQILREAALFDIEYIQAMPASVKQALIIEYQKKLDDKNSKQ